ncbi:MAG: hypothetical protein ACXWQQ_13160, partial [Pseudobdellovibrio sp.]
YNISNLLRIGLFPFSKHALSGIFRVRLAETKNRDEWKLLAWVERKEKKLVAVSHEPFMSEFVKLAVGRKIRIKKGNIVVLKIKGKKFHLIDIY